MSSHSPVPKASMKMNSPEGKALLALIREGDFAHPGEREAVELVFSGISTSDTRRILDIGCGRGGTAQIVNELRLGRVTGVDIDSKSIDYASNRYPEVNFVCGDALSLPLLSRDNFELIYMFNVLYTLKDKPAALREAAQVASNDAALHIFDYSMNSTNTAAHRFIREYEGSRFEPIELDRIDLLLEGSGWKNPMITDITGYFARWYRSFLEKLELHHNDLATQFSEALYRVVYQKFHQFCRAAEDGVIGGVIIRLEREA